MPKAAQKRVCWRVGQNRQSHVNIIESFFQATRRGIREASPPELEEQLEEAWKERLDHLKVHFDNGYLSASTVTIAQENQSVKNECLDLSNLRRNRPLLIDID
jgi:hypothetical protein